MKVRKKMVIAVLAAVGMVSCEKAVFDEVDDVTQSSASGNVTIRVTPYEQLDFEDGVAARNHTSSVSTRSAKSVDEICTRIDMGIYKDSALVKSITQTSDDSDFGTTSVQLDEGTYKVVIVAHNGLVKCSVPKTFGDFYFSNNKVTDTFHYYGEVEVTSSSLTLEAEVRRIVAMFRLRVTGEIPEDADSLNFYYTGGSTKIDPTTGYGTTNSKPNDYRLVYQDVTDYEIYTIPHEDDDVLKVVVTAYDTNGEARMETTFSDVPVSVNQITQYSGDFFSGWTTTTSTTETGDSESEEEEMSETSVVEWTVSGIMGDDAWEEQQDYSF